MNIHTTLMVVVKCDTPHSCLMVNPHLSGAADVNTVYATNSILVGKTAIFEPFIYKMHYFTKTGSEQT
jgi:hypothetical protein